jgi:hypothetical protein
MQFYISDQHRFKSFGRRNFILNKIRIKSKKQT